MSFYEGIEKESAATDRGAFMRAGRYLAVINRIRSGRSDRHSCDYVAVDMTILHAYDDGERSMIVNPESGNIKDWVEDPKGLHRAGEDVSVQFMSKYVSAKRNYKAFVANAVGVTENDINPEFCRRVEEDELLSGEVVELNNRMIEKKDGGPFTKVWVVRPVPASEFSEVLAEAVAKRHFPEGFADLIAAEEE